MIFVESNLKMLQASLLKGLTLQSRNKGRWRTRNLKASWVAYPLRFCILRVFCVPDESAGQRVGTSSLGLIR